MSLELVAVAVGPDFFRFHCDQQLVTKTYLFTFDIILGLLTP